MSYDHAKKAGNLADVWKHAVLVSVALRVDALSTFTYLESHAGAPAYRLPERGEWRGGIGTILDRCSDESHPYLALARQSVATGVYRSGWSFFVQVVSKRAPEVIVDLCDTSAVVAQAYAISPALALPSNVSTRYHNTDGFEHAQRANANLVFLDPPYHPDADADWRALAETCRVLQKQRTPFLAWYPFYWPTNPRRLVEATGQRAWEVCWKPCGTKPSQNLKGCGMLASPMLLPILESAHEELASVARLIGAGDILVRRPEPQPS